MSQKFALHALVFLSGLMAGVLVESRLFHSRRIAAMPSSSTAAATVPTSSTQASSEAPRQDLPAKPSNAIIQVDNPVYDFGTAETGGKIEREFSIKNAGTDPLMILQVQAGCGCTTADLAKKEIEPGGTTKLKAVLDLNGRVGKQNSVITIRSNDAKQSSLRISLVGEATSRVVMTPVLADFGRVKEAGADASLPVQIQISNGSPLKILSAETTDPLVTARLEEVSAGSSYRVHVSVLPGAVAGPFRAHVRLLTDAGAPYQELRLPVQAYVGSGGPILSGDELEISGPTVDGGVVDLKSMRGKVCVIVFWASWCGHCQAEFPELVELYKRHQDNGLAILGVNNDSSLEKAVAAVNKYKLPWPNIVSTGDGSGDGSNPLFTKHAIHGIPAVFVVGRDGRVASVGLRKAALKVRVEQLLKSNGVAAIK